jgi:hypothetical protein
LNTNGRNKQENNSSASIYWTAGICRIAKGFKHKKDRRTQVKNAVFALLLSALLPCRAAEHILSPENFDAGKLVSSLSDGDIVTFMPGEYHGSIVTDKSNITIRAAIPGTAVLRGDIDAPVFEKTGELIWSCHWSSRPGTVNERDTLTIYAPVFSLSELETTLSAWYYDKDKEALCVHASDSDDPARHYLTISTAKESGICFQSKQGSKDGIRNVNIDGLAVTGYYNFDKTSFWSRKRIFWGVFIQGAKNCRVNNVSAFLCAGGIGLCGDREDFGGAVEDSVIENCRSLENFSDFNMSGGSISFYGEGAKSGVRNCFASDTRRRAIGFYPSGRSHRGCFMLNNVCFGGCRSKGISDTLVSGNHIDGRGDMYDAVRFERNFVTGNIVFSAKDPDFNINIIGSRNKDIVPERDFADPAHFDFRPQAGSNYTAVAPRHFDPALYFVKNGGNDFADGNSLATAFGALAGALGKLSDGSTLYIVPGNWGGDIRLENLRDVTVRGRGDIPVKIAGNIIVENCANISLDTLVPDSIIIENSPGVSITQCVSEHLNASGSPKLAVKHNLLDSAVIKGCENAVFTANVLKAKTMDSGWSDYNAYADNVPSSEKHSFKASPVAGKNYSFKNAWRFNGRAIDGMPVGPFRRQESNTALVFDRERAVNVTSSSANIETLGRMMMDVKIYYGTTPECKDGIRSSVGTYANIGLTGLNPGAPFYFKARAAATPPKVWSNQEPSESSANKVVWTTPIKINIPSEDPPPRIYHVAKTGSDTNEGSAESPWLTISHAALKVKAGDTVIIHQGVYSEGVRAMATGVQGKPITFAAAKDEEALIDGLSTKIRHGFQIVNQSFINLERLHFYGCYHSAVWIRDSNDINLRECLFEGKLSERWVTAENTARLSLENCAAQDSREGAHFIRCQNLLIKNCALVCGYVCQIRVDNTGKEKAAFLNNIFTDNAYQKTSTCIIKVSYIDSLTEANNCFYLRVPDGKRPVLGYDYLNGKCGSGRKDNNFLGFEQISFSGYLRAVGRESSSFFASPDFPVCKLLEHPNLTSWKAAYEKIRFKSSLEETVDYKSKSKLEYFKPKNPELLKRGVGVDFNLLQ